MRDHYLSFVSSVVFMFASSCGASELYLLTGSPTPKYNITYPSSLYRVADEGKAVLVTTVVPQEIGTEWIAVSDEWKKAVFLPWLWKSDVGDVVVLDFTKLMVVKRCPLPVHSDMSLIEQWLVDVPGKGPSVVAYSVRYSESHKLERFALDSMTLDANTPCERSWSTLTPDEIVNVMAHGEPGVADLAPSDRMFARINASGELVTFAGDSTPRLPIQIPARLLSDVDPGPLIFVRLNTTHLLAVGVSTKTRDFRNLVLRKHDQTWRVLPTFSPGSLRIRAFGLRIAMTESRTKDTNNPESAGRREWKRKDEKVGPGVEYRFEDSLLIYPGRLHIYDVQTERTYTIETKQGDSEIVLIEGNLVYYRVSDRIYSAPITDSGIGAPRLLVQAEEMRDVHWAFTK